MKLSAKQQLLLKFVKQTHKGQVRKYTNQPYWLHPLAVAEILYNSIQCNGDLGLMIEAALCHDIIEDQYDRCNEVGLVSAIVRCGYTYLEAMQIAIIVLELTDVYTVKNTRDLNRATRKEFEARRLWGVSYAAQTVKYADLINNTSDIIDHDEGFGKVYLMEKSTIMVGMDKGYAPLYADCMTSLVNGKNKIGRDKIK